MKEGIAGTSIQVLVTGRLWLGVEGARPIGSSLVEILNNAKQEVIIVAYRLTTAVPEFTQSIEAALARGCYVRVIRDQQLKKIDVEEKYFNNLLKKYETLTIWDFFDADPMQNGCSLHAKMVIVDRVVAVVGSANFSRNGMRENHELAIQLSGTVARSLGVACDKLIENGLKEGIVSRRERNET